MAVAIKNSPTRYSRLLLLPFRGKRKKSNLHKSLSRFINDIGSFNAAACSESIFSTLNYSINRVDYPRSLLEA